ncbi:1,5-anhydro-D-fructose reductase [bioreactor metagenome]|uniref:1,5-anhydro-D-fructose reductase n=1 Tax=bioreactor metagenome TaxID=1076179 RepID=A0A644ZQH2_9ZZZZ|nr:Gfo/Idh/MocA family oxidoreductase [Oscillospiraceae bacterium]
MKKVKWGVLGAGGIADRRTLPGMMLANNAELVAVMEVNKDFAEKLRVKYNAKRAYDNTQDLVNDPEIEAIYIASPVIYHKEQVIAAAKAKKHLLVEKPIAMTIDDCNELVNACNKAGVLSATGFMMRYGAYNMAMKKLVSEGAIGQIVSARGQLTCWYPEIPGAWRQNKSLSGGGALIDMGIHCIDLIEYITGSKTVATFGINETKTFKYNVDDSSNILLKLSNGATAYVDSNFNIPDAAAKCRLEFYGTRGSILAEGTIGQIDGGKIDVVISEAGGYDAAQNRNDVTPLEVKVDFGNMYTREIESFSNSILTGAPVQVPMTDAVWIQKVVEAAYKSGETGTLVTL